MHKRVAGRFVCGCGRTFQTQELLDKHRSEEVAFDLTDDRSHVCPLCNERKRVFVDKREGYRKFCVKCCHKYTEKSFELRYGKEDGQKRWNEYREKQRISNTFEYKQKKYGWTKEQFDAFNKSRAVTKENLIKKHGEVVGAEKFKNYCEKQRYTNTKDYFVEKYGAEKGTQEYDRI